MTKEEEELEEVAQRVVTRIIRFLAPQPRHSPIEVGFRLALSEAIRSYVSGENTSMEICVAKETSHLRELE